MIGPNLLERAIPLFQRELLLLDDSYRIDSLTLSQPNVGAKLILNVGLARTKLIGQRVLVPDHLGRGTAKVSILCGPLFFPWLFAWSFVLSVPKLALSRRMLALGMATLLSAANVFLDVPVIFLAELEDMLWSAQSLEENSLLIIYKEFLDGGGRIAIGLFIGWLALICQASIKVSNSSLRDKTNTQ